MNKKLRPKWCEDSIMGKAPVMKKDKMVHMEECLDEGMGEGQGDMEIMLEGHAEPGTMVLAHAYVPWQCYDKAFAPCQALMRGTLFPELWGVYPIPE